MEPTNNPNGYPIPPQSNANTERKVPIDLLTDADYRQVEHEVQKDKNKGIIMQLSGVLSSLLLLFGTLNIEFSWFTQESINAFVLFIGAFAAFGISAWTTYKSSYAFKHGQEKNRRIKEAEIAERRLKQQHKHL